MLTIGLCAENLIAVGFQIPEVKSAVVFPESVAVGNGYIRPEFDGFVYIWVLSGCFPHDGRSRAAAVMVITINALIFISVISIFYRIIPHGNITICQCGIIF